MTLYTTQYDHTKLAEAVALFTQLDEVKQHPEILEPHQWRIDRWREGLYLVVVVGEVKKGKSSFVNAFLDQSGLSPVADKIASAVPVKILYGEQLRYWVHFLPDETGERPDPMEITAEALPQYATEHGVETEQGTTDTGNFDNRLAVDFVCVEHPHRFLREGLVVVDLPGLGGVFKHHARLVWEYLDPQRADHIVFVFDSTGNPFAAEEKKAIQAIRERDIDRFMFLQTKTDCADPEKVEAWQATNLKALSELLDRPVAELKYFPISNLLKQQWLTTGREKDLIRSGFVELENYLTHSLMPTKKDWLAEPVLLGLSQELDALRQQVETQRKIFKEKSVAERDRVAQAYQEKKQAFENWRRKVYVEIKNEMNGELRAAKIEANDRIQGELYPSKITAPVYTRVERETQSEKNVLEIQEEIRQHCIDSVLQRYTKIDERYRIKVEKAFSTAMQQLEQTMPSPYIDQHEPNPKDIETIRLSSKNRWMEYIQRSWSSFAVGGVAGSFIAGPIGGIIGALGGTWKAVREAKERNKEAALTKLKGLLDDAVRQAQMQATRSMRKTCDKTEAEYNKNLQNAANIRFERLHENAASAAQRVKDTDTAIAKQREQLQKNWKNIEAVDTLLRASANLD